MRVMHVPDAMTDSWEHIVHQLDAKDRIIIMDERLKRELEGRDFGHRAIGVVYHPHYERPGNYVPSQMTERYDAFVYLDRTSALHPIHVSMDAHQMPETFPFGV